MVFCADCGKKMYLCRSRSYADNQEHLTCSTYGIDRTACTAHYIRTAVLNEIVLNELNSLLTTVKDSEDDFVQTAMERSEIKQSSDIAKAKKSLKQAENRIEELDRLFTKLYEDNVSGRITDSRFDKLSQTYENEQEKLNETGKELSAKIETAEQKTTDVIAFVRIVKKYQHITELTPEIMHELIEKIVVHAPEKADKHRTQQVDIYYRFGTAMSTAVADSRDYIKRTRTGRKKAA